MITIRLYRSYPSIATKLFFLLCKNLELFTTLYYLYYDQRMHNCLSNYHPLHVSTLSRHPQGQLVINTLPSHTHIWNSAVGIKIIFTIRFGQPDHSQVIRTVYRTLGRIAVTWLIIWGGGIRPRVLGTLTYEGINLLCRGKIGLNQSLIYTYPFPPALAPIFCFAYLQLSRQKQPILRQKKYLGRRRGICPTPQVMFILGRMSGT